MNLAAQYSEKILSRIKNSVQKSLAFFQLVSPYWFLFMLEQIVYIFCCHLKKKKGKLSGLWLGNCNHDSFLLSAILLQISLCIMAEHLHFGLIFLNAVVPEVLWFVQLQLFKPRLCCHVLFKQKKLSPGNPVKQATLAQLFSNCTVMKVNMLSEAWSLTCSCLFSGGFLWGLDGLTLGWICGVLTAEWWTSIIFLRLMGSNHHFFKIPTNWQNLYFYKGADDQLTKSSDGCYS